MSEKFKSSTMIKLANINYTKQNEKIISLEKKKRTKLELVCSISESRCLKF